MAQSSYFPNPSMAKHGSGTNARMLAIYLYLSVCLSV